MILLHSLETKNALTVNTLPAFVIGSLLMILILYNNGILSLLSTYYNVNKVLIMGGGKKENMLVLYIYSYKNP